MRASRKGGEPDALSQLFYRGGGDGSDGVGAATMYSWDHSFLVYTLSWCDMRSVGQRVQERGDKIFGNAPFLVMSKHPKSHTNRETGPKQGQIVITWNGPSGRTDRRRKRSFTGLREQPSYCETKSNKFPGNQGILQSSQSVPFC